MDRRSAPGEGGRALKNALASLISGVVATWAMTRCGRWWVRVAQRRSDGGAGPPPGDIGPLTQDDRATAAIVQAAAPCVLQRRLTASELDRAIPILRYGFGAAAGLAYGLAADRLGGGIAAGAAWGTMLWIVNDEIALPAIGGVDRVSAERPQAFTCHLVYGMTTEAVRRVVQSLM